MHFIPQACGPAPRPLAQPNLGGARGLAAQGTLLTWGWPRQWSPEQGAAGSRRACWCGVGWGWDPGLASALLGEAESQLRGRRTGRAQALTQG